MYSQRNQILNNQQFSFNVDNNPSNNQFLNQNYQPNPNLSLNDINLQKEIEKANLLNLLNNLYLETSYPNINNININPNNNLSLPKSIFGLNTPQNNNMNNINNVNNNNIINNLLLKQALLLQLLNNKNNLSTNKYENNFINNNINNFNRKNFQ